MASGALNPARGQPAAGSQRQRRWRWGWGRTVVLLVEPLVEGRRVHAAVGGVEPAVRHHQEHRQVQRQLRPRGSGRRPSRQPERIGDAHPDDGVPAAHVDQRRAPGVRPLLRGQRRRRGLHLVRPEALAPVRGVHPAAGQGDGEVRQGSAEVERGEADGQAQREGRLVGQPVGRPRRRGERRGGVHARCWAPRGVRGFRVCK